MAYATISEVRALSRLSNATDHPDAILTEAIAWATQKIDLATGTSWETKSHTLVLDGNGKDRIATGIVDLASVTSCSINDVSQTVTGWTVHSNGEVRSNTNLFTFKTVGQNIDLVVTAGTTATCPEDIAWCARTLARQYALDLQSVVPDRALQIQNEYGTVQLAQAGGRYGSSSLPEVNAILSDRNARPPRIG